MKIKPLHNHVVIKQIDESETMYGNIIVSDVGKEKAFIGEVIAVGPGIRDLNGNIIPMQCKEGFNVSFPAFGGQRITIEGNEYLIYKDSDIFCVLIEDVNIPAKLDKETTKSMLNQ